MNKFVLSVTNFRQNWTIQLFLLIFLPIAVLLLVISFGGFQLHQQAMRSMVGERDQRATLATAVAIEEQIQRRVGSLESLAVLVESEESANAALLSADYLSASFEEGVAIFNQSGQLLATSSENQGIWGREEAQNRINRVFSEYRGGGVRFETADHITFAYLITDSFVIAGGFSPILVAERALNNLTNDDGATRVFVFGPSNEVVFTLSDQQIQPGGETHHLSDFVDRGSGMEYITIDGEEQVVTFTEISGVDWTLVVEEPWDTVTDPILRTTELAPLSLIPVLIIGLGVLWFVIQQIIRPLQTLEKQAAALGWGNYELIKEPVNGITEIESLQVALSHMAQQVQRSQQNLKGFLDALTLGQEEERKRLAREIHDDTIQSLIALNQQIQLAELRLNEHESQTPLKQMKADTTKIISNLRRLTRDLRPIYLEDLGLTPSLNMLASDLGKHHRLGISFRTAGREKRLAPHVELALFRIAQESLNNVAKHANATRATVFLGFLEDRIILEIEDNGIGFEIGFPHMNDQSQLQFGLLGMKERADSIGAKLEIESSLGDGTKIIVFLQA